MLAFLFLLATAHAGELEVTVTIDEASTTFHFEQLASCSSTSVSFSADDYWSLGAMATGVEEGIYVSLELEANVTSGSKHPRRVVSQPSFIVVPDEEAVLRVGGDGGDLIVQVLASGFDQGDSSRCYPGSRRIRSLRSTSEQSSEEG